MNGDPCEYAAPDTRCSERSFRVNKSISLRAVSFEPLRKSQNPIVIFVPGWISLISAWEEVLRELTKDFAVLYLETREKRSSRIYGDAGFAVEDIAKDIAFVASALDAGNGGFIILGSSLGATAVIESCRFLKQRPRCLVLIAPNTEFRIPALGLFIIKATTPYLYFIIKPIIKWYLRTSRLDLQTDRAQYEKYCNSLDAADPWKLKKAAIAFSRYCVLDALRYLSMPVLVFGASKDVLHEPENLKKMLSGMKRVTQIDLQTNRQTHSVEMVRKLRDYLRILMKGEHG